MSILETAPKFEAADSYPRYDMSPEEARELCAEFLLGQEQAPDSQFGCYIFGGSDRFSNLGRFVESSVFYETFGNTPEKMQGEYGPYENASEFIAVIDQDATIPVGVLRTIRSNEAALKSLIDLKNTPLQLQPEDVYEKFGINPDKCVDVGTLAVLPEYRGSTGQYLPTLLLYRVLYREYLNDPDTDHVVTIIDKKAEKGLYKWNFPFQPIDEQYFSYLDSEESRALYGVTSEFYPSVIAKQIEVQKQAIENDSSVKLWQAAMLDGLANGTALDEMVRAKASINNKALE
jgi:hypothetical protein